MSWSALVERVRPVESVVVGCGMKVIGGWWSTDAVTEAPLDVRESRRAMRSRIEQDPRIGPIVRALST